MDKIYITVMRIFWFVVAVRLAMVPHLGTMVILSFTTCIILFQEYLNMVRIDEKTVAKFMKFKHDINTRCNTVQEQVEEFETTVRVNTANISEHEEAITRLRTAGDFREIN